MLHLSLAADLIRLALYALMAVVVFAGFSSCRAQAQVSSSFGGDLRGKASNAEVVGLRHLPIGTASPSPEDALIFRDGEWGPHEQASGGGSASDYPNLISTLTVTSTIFVGTSQTTVTSITVPSANVTPPFGVDLLLWGTATVTATGNVTQRVFLNGRQLSQGVGAPSVGLNYWSGNIGFIWLRSGGAGSSHAIYIGGGLAVSQTSITAPHFLSGNGVLISPGVPDNLDALVEVTWAHANNNPGNLFTKLRQSIHVFR